jgi:hypothetical protein
MLSVNSFFCLLFGCCKFVMTRDVVVPIEMEQRNVLLSSAVVVHMFSICTRKPIMPVRSRMRPKSHALGTIG